MILNLTELRNEFENLKNIRLNIKEHFEHLSDKIDMLTNIYGNYIKEQEHTGGILFGLDALHFQTFLIHFEYDNMKKMHILIENKLYCEYYKLFKLIVQYVKLNIKEENILSVCDHKSKYPIYKDLEQYKIYEFELINQIHDDILLLLELMSKFVIKKEKELEEDETNTTNGLNLHIVVNTIDFNITLLKQNLKLYTNYLKIFHKYHTTYLSRLNIKIGIMWGQVSKDIKIQQNTSKMIDYKCNNDERKYEKIIRSPSLTNVEQKELLSFINTNNVSLSVKDELNEIMINISDESSNDNSTDNDFTTIMNSNTCQDANENNGVLNDNTDIAVDESDHVNHNEMDINNNSKYTKEENSKMNTEFIVNHSCDIGDLTSNELKNRWNIVLNDIQMEIEDRNSISTELKIESVDDINHTDDSISEIKNEKDELEKWREIINNPLLTQEEKLKEKAKLKRMRYKLNKKHKISGR